MSRAIFGNLLNENATKQNSYCLPSSLDSNYEKQLYNLVDETKAAFGKLPSNPQILSQMPNLPFSNLNSLNSNFPLNHNLSEPDSGYCESGDSEKEYMSASHRENLLEIDNHHLVEQNRLLTKELIHCKFNIESYKKVVSTKDAQIEQFALEQKILKNQAKALENIIDWFHSHAPQALWDSCPYSPTHITSSLSSLGSEEDSPENSIKQLTVSNELKIKNEHSKPDSYRFMRNLFKFNQSKPKLRTKDNEEWINCEDEVMEENIGAESFVLNQSNRSSSLELPRLKSPKKDSRTIFSSLRLNKQSISSSLDENLTSSESRECVKSSVADNLCSRTELRNRISSRPVPNDSLSPQTTSPGSLNTSESFEEEEDSILDVDADLAALSPLDFESEPVLKDIVICSEPEPIVPFNNIHSICENIENSSHLSDESLSPEENLSNNSNISKNEKNIRHSDAACKDNYIASDISKEKSLETRLSTSPEKMIDVISIHSRPMSTQINSINNNSYDSQHSSGSSIIDFEKLAQRPDRPLPLTPASPYFSLKLVASQKLKSGLSLFRIKKTSPIRRRSSHRRPLSGTSVRSINGNNKARTSLEL